MNFYNITIILKSLEENKPSNGNFKHCSNVCPSTNITCMDSLTNVQKSVCYIPKIMAIPHTADVTVHFFD